MKSYKILIVTDAWHPQVNGVVTTLSYLVEELKKKQHEVFLITPNDFITVPCPTYPEIKLSINAYPKIYKKIKEIIIEKKLEIKPIKVINLNGIFECLITPRMPRS